MTSKETLIASVLSLATFTTSLGFTFLGVTVVGTENALPLQIATAFASAAYGMGMFSVLSWAWLRGGHQLPSYAKYLALGYLAFFFFTSMDAGIISGLEFAGIFAVALILWLNWYSVKFVVLTRQNA